MEYEKHREQCIEKTKQDSAFLKELNSPVFIDHKGDEYGFSYNKQNNVCTQQLDPKFYRYKNILERKIKFEKDLNIKKEKQRSDIFYRRISLLCIILGHISGIW